MKAVFVAFTCLCCTAVVGLPQAARAQAVEPDAERSAAPATRARPADPEAVRRALAELSHEPSIERVVRATRSTGPHGNSQELASRARTAGWVPRIGLRARRGQAVDLSSSQDAEALKLSTDDDLTLEASLTFELDRVVFRREEVALQRQAQAEQQAMQQRVREVIKLYFERRRLQLEQRLIMFTAERAMRIAELEALLDNFTGGKFRRMIDASP